MLLLKLSNVTGSLHEPGSLKPSAAQARLTVKVDAMDTSERWDRIESLFHAAVELPDSERATFLRNLGGEDPEIIDEVIALITAHTAGNELLDNPTLPADKRLLTERSTKPAAFFTRGATLGNYRIVA